MIWKWVQEKFSEKNDGNYLSMNQVWYEQSQNPSYLRIILQSLVCTGSIWEIETSFYSGYVSQSHGVSALDSKIDIWIMKYFMEFHDVFLMIFSQLWVNWLLLDSMPSSTLKLHERKNDQVTTRAGASYDNVSVFLCW